MDLIEQFKQQLKGLEISPELEETGEVIEVKDGVVKAFWIKKCREF